MLNLDTYGEANSHIDNLFTIKVPSSDWIQQNIDLTLITSCPTDGLVKLDPYQIPIFNALDKPEVRKVTVMACERLGKSVIWEWYLLYRMAVEPLPSLIVYRSDEEASDTNRDVVEPLIRGIPRLAKELEAPFSKRKDSYRFSDSVTYFQGSGSPILSKTVGLGIMDELDFHRSELETKEEARKDVENKTVTVPNLMNLEKRLLNHRAKKQSKLIAVSSPTERGSPIHKSYNESSQGYWTLRCLSCSGLMDSSKLTVLQWTLDEEGRLEPESIFLQCPYCSHKHNESQAEEMNVGGRYVYEDKDNTEHYGFRFGALACPRVWGWEEIARAQLRAGKSAELAYQKYLDNSVRGLPYIPRKQDKPRVDNIKKHCGPLPEPDKVKGIFLTADTQTYRGYYYVVRAYDDNKNSWLLDYGQVETLRELNEVWQATYLGRFKAIAGMIDEGGHLQEEVRGFVAGRPGLYTYKGNSKLTGDELYRISPNFKKLLVCKPYDYQEKLLYQIYSQTDKDIAPYWFLPNDISDEYLNHIECIRPSSRKINGDKYKNWIKTDNKQNDDFFDAEKEQFALLDYARDKLSAPNYWYGNSTPNWVKEELLLKLSSRKSGIKKGISEENT